MAAINDLIRQVEDKSLRERLQQEVARLSKQKKFGLVFEDHIPECTPLYGIPIRKGSLVAVKGEDIEVLPKSWTKVMRQSHFEFCIGQDLTHSIFL